ncbi:MAG: HD-GYP domain-containing protein [Muribaculaceae bacterium]|nr:HD-GYP domain-containing protein [Muribaculaceae bacterium]
MKYMRIKDVRPGDITASGLYDNRNRLMLASNMELTEPIIQRLRSLDFHGIYVLDGYSDTAYEPLLDDETRKAAIDSLMGLSLDQIRYIANSIVNQVLYGADRLYDMMTVSSYDMLTYNHSVNVTVLAVMMGVQMGLGNAKLLELGQAALFHDIGKTRVDPRIIKKNGKLDLHERAEVEKHPGYGYDMLDPAVASEQVRMSVRRHHENEDGTGYPDKVPGPDIPLYAKIIHVADVYDAMVSKRSYKDRLNPADVLEHIMANVGTMFDLECVKAIQNSVALYPDGVKVMLSIGVPAYVQRNRKGFPSRPDVITDAGIKYSLMERLDITITKLITV